MTKPLLLIDVDGVLNPFAVTSLADVTDYETHWMRPDCWTEPGDLLVWLNPGHGPALTALPYELVWATTWQHDANTWIAPRIGLPELPVITWTDMDTMRADGTYWKTHEIVRWAAGRPFAWIDDQLDDTDRAYVAAHHDGPALLYGVNPALGLRETDFAALADWAASLTTEAGR